MSNDDSPADYDAPYWCAQFVGGMYYGHKKARATVSPDAISRYSKLKEYDASSCSHDIKVSLAKYLEAVYNFGGIDVDTKPAKREGCLIDLIVDGNVNKCEENKRERERAEERDQAAEIVLKGNRRTRIRDLEIELEVALQEADFRGEKY